MNLITTSSKNCTWVQVTAVVGTEQTQSFSNMHTGEEETKNWNKEVLHSLLSVKETEAVGDNMQNFPVWFGAIFIKMISHLS